jgi:hypothetical protein
MYTTIRRTRNIIRTNWTVRRKPLAIGDHVRLRRPLFLRAGPRPVTTIEGHFTEIEGGVVLTDRLEGFYCWNERDLERVPTPRKSP